MEVTVLGNNGPFPAAGGACSGYLVRENGTNILLDCGNGVLSNLQKFIKFEDLDAIILTHLHSDHISDMMVLRYAVQIKNKRALEKKFLNVYAPQEPSEEYSRLDVKDAYILKPITTDTELSFGQIKISFCEMKHPVKTYAVCCSSRSKRFVYSADTSWNDALIEFSRGSDLLMLDANLLAQDKAAGTAVHLTAEECGMAASRAGASRLLLTHLWPEYNAADLAAEASKHFINTEVSEMLRTYSI